MAKLLAAPTKNAVQKTLAAQLLSTATTGDPITFDDVDGIPNLPGVLVVRRVSSAGVTTPEYREYIEYSGTSGTTVIIETRNVDGSNSALTHPIGSIVEFIPDVTWADRIYDALATLVDATNTSVINPSIVTTPLSTTHAISSSGATISGFLDDDTFSTASATTLPTSESVKAYVDANSGGDWRLYAAVTPTSGTLDDPSFELTFAGVDLTTTIYPGMRVRYTQGTVKYGIVTKMAFSTNTTMTIYGGTDYDLISTGTTAITAFAYSSVKAPAGFPLDPTKWTVEATDTSSRTQATPGAGTWYNLGSVSISIPIGIWDTQYKVNAGVLKNASTVWNRVYTTLSTANNSATDSDLTAGCGSYSSTSMDRGTANTLIASKNIVLTTKTTHYLNTSCESASTTLYNNNDLQKLIIRAVCAYL